MIPKLLAYAKSPTVAITAIALTLVGFLSTTVVNQQTTIAAQQAHFQERLDEHTARTDKLIEGIIEAQNQLLKEQVYANSVSIRMLREICYSNAKDDTQRRRCVDLR
jgi:hypothetical protein